MSGIRVLIAEDHPITRLGLRKWLEVEPGIEVVGETSTTMETLRQLQLVAPDVLLLDLVMPGQGGVSIVKKVKRNRLPVRILVFSAYDDREFVKKLFEQGVSGYLVKGEDLERISAAIRGIAKGEKGWMSRRVMARLSMAMQRTNNRPHGLTERELTVLCSLANGQTNQCIAHELGISSKTVDKHVQKVFRKLRVNSRVEAALYAVEHGWIT